MNGEKVGQLNDTTYDLRGRGAKYHANDKGALMAIALSGWI